MEADFDEDKIKRDEDGQFAPKDGGNTGDKKEENKKKKKKKADSKPKSDSQSEHDWRFSRTGPSTAKQRKKGKLPPKLDMVIPPKPRKANVAPKGKDGRPSKGYAANGMKATYLGDFAEKVVGQLGLRSILPKGKRNNTNVEKEGSSIDVEFDHSGYAFEIKAVCVEASSYKAGPKKKEVAGKHAFAEMHDLKPCMMIVVMDIEGGKGWCYWQEGIQASHRINLKKMDSWNFAGEISFPATTAKAENEKRDAEKALAKQQEKKSA